MAEGEYKPEVTAVGDIDYANNIFDGQKADIFINTGRFDGKVFLVRVDVGEREPTLIAIHL